MLCIGVLFQEERRPKAAYALSLQGRVKRLGAVRVGA